MTFADEEMRFKCGIHNAEKIVYAVKNYDFSKICCVRTGINMGMGI